MTNSASRIRLVALLPILAFVSTPALCKQSSGCAPREAVALLRPADSEYTDASELRQRLEAHGIIVRCVLRSKMTGLFEGQKGAALYRTGQGDFEALFLVHSDSWAALEIIQTEKDGWYICSFRGLPKPWPANRMEGPTRTYFVKHANDLCLTSNEQLSKKLDHILNLN